jgi:hypothetical protein
MSPKKRSALIIGGIVCGTVLVAGLGMYLYFIISFQISTMALINSLTDSTPAGQTAPANSEARAGTTVQSKDGSRLKSKTLHGKSANGSDVVIKLPSK